MLDDDDKAVIKIIAICLAMAFVFVALTVGGCFLFAKISASDKDNCACKVEGD